MTARRGGTPTKGDRSQAALLDAFERLLGEQEPSDLTIADIAHAAGLSRAAVYFHYGSRDDIVAGLVERTVSQLWQRSERVLESSDPAAAIEEALSRTVEIWGQHGLVLRLAIDASASSAEVRALWDRTTELFVRAIEQTLLSAGMTGGTEPDQAGAVAVMLCRMIERSFYLAWPHGTEQLEQAARTAQFVWSTVAGLEELGTG